MPTYTITGGKPLKGTIRIGGSKNAVLPLLASTLLVKEPCKFTNVPDISDVDVMLDILQGIGATVTRNRQERTVVVDTTDAEFFDITGEDTNGKDLQALSGKIRASYYFLGALLARFGKAITPSGTGGDQIGRKRTMNYHIDGLETLGATIELDDTLKKYISCVSHSEPVVNKSRLLGNFFHFPQITVGATVNMILASVTARGVTILENAAQEPHIINLINFLNSLGAKIEQTSRKVMVKDENGNLQQRSWFILTITGVESLHSPAVSEAETKKLLRRKASEERVPAIECEVIPDSIEACTYMSSVVATGGEVTLTYVEPAHLKTIAAVLSRLGADVDFFEDTVDGRKDVPCVTVSMTGHPHYTILPEQEKASGKFFFKSSFGENTTDDLLKTNSAGEHVLEAKPYPYFPTDMQPFAGVLMAMTCSDDPQNPDNIGVIKETVWDKRFGYLDELNKMGANTKSPGDKFGEFHGVRRLKGAKVNAIDLRAGAALIVAGLAADGVTTVYDASCWVARGYENLLEKLLKLGASIEITD